jgi:hypothetical protein
VPPPNVAENSSTVSATGICSYFVTDIVSPLPLTASWISAVVSAAGYLQFVVQFTRFAFVLWPAMLVRPFDIIECDPALPCCATASAYKIRTTLGNEGLNILK